MFVFYEKEGFKEIDFIDKVIVIAMVNDKIRYKCHRSEHRYPSFIFIIAV